MIEQSSEYINLKLNRDAHSRWPLYEALSTVCVLPRGKEDFWSMSGLALQWLVESLTIAPPEHLLRSMFRPVLNRFFSSISDFNIMVVKRDFTDLWICCSGTKLQCCIVYNDVLIFLSDFVGQFWGSLQFLHLILQSVVIVTMTSPTSVLSTVVLKPRFWRFGHRQLVFWLFTIIGIIIYWMNLMHWRPPETTHWKRYSCFTMFYVYWGKTMTEVFLWNQLFLLAVEHWFPW